MQAASPGISERRTPRRGLWIRLGFALLVVAMVLALAVRQLVAEDGSGSGDAPTADLASAAGADPQAPSTERASTTTIAPTTTTTIPPLTQPPAAVLPPVPGGEARSGASSAEIAAYEQRLHDLRFDPGPIDGRFDEELRFSVEAVEKLLGWERNGRIDQPFVDAIAAFRYPQPLKPASEPDRVEIDLDRQVLTVYEGWQVGLITTTSTGNGKRFCGGADGCQYAVTPVGRYVFQWHVDGWRDGDLGRLYNPWYFNGGIAVHGYSSVPTQAASHGCARIPMHVSEHFGDLVRKGMPVHVVGTQAPTSGGPLPSGSNAPQTTAPPATTAPPSSTPPTTPPAPPPPPPPLPPPPPPTTTLPPPPPDPTTTTTLPPPAA